MLDPQNSAGSLCHLSGPRSPAAHYVQTQSLSACSNVSIGDHVLLVL